MGHKCLECKKIYSVNAYRKNATKYCSRQCANTGIARRPVTWGAKIGAKNRGNKRPDLAEYNKKHPRSGAENALWKGSEAGYISKHIWVRKHYGKPVRCENCNSVQKIQWANKSGKYLRERSDWLSLCPKCHYRFDIKIHIKAIKRRIKNNKLKKIWNHKLR